MYNRSNMMCAQSPRRLVIQARSRRTDRIRLSDVMQYFETLGTYQSHLENF